MHAARSRRGWLALAAILVGALALRLWGIAQGLPYAYNSDENAHFAPKAIAMFSGGLNPGYFANPPAFTYLLHVLYAAWFGGGAAARHALVAHPTEVFVLGRVAAALLGTLAVWLLYLVGTRLFTRAVGLLAAALEAVAFLPVFYAHLALNDVPTLAPLTLALLGAAGVLRKGRRRDYLMAGIGLGLGCATKYTAGIVVLPMLAAAACQYLDAPQVRARVAVGMALAGAAALASFLIANPYALLDFNAFHAELNHQSQLSGEAQGKLGAGHEGGVRYYLWSLTWGLGWLPALAALGGTVTVWRKEERLGWLLVPAPLLFLAFMGLQGRYFGRWLLPIFPIVCLLAAFFTLQAVEALAVRSKGWVLRGRVSRTAMIAVAAVALCAQALVYTVHSDLLLSRADTRTLTREWMVMHIPAGTKIVAEPVSPDVWASDIGHFNYATPEGARWIKYSSLRSVIAANGALVGEPGRRVGIEDYERTLSPALIGWYERQGYCWVITGSTQSGRAQAEPGAVPNAVAYYRALAQQAQVVYRVSPYSPGEGPVAFNFDWSFDYYPLAYHRPGPEMIVYRLHGGSCQSA
ncbi:MAG TPA: glycosyltransferase family 39 protein [Solirubrobacteraceae bacterium]|jgi:4-amino-4-deoxy-L-arabinose transferase-like glycosyltransferase